MGNIIHEAGWGAWPSLIFTVVGVLAILTLGRRIGRAGSVAVGFASAVMASGFLGTAMGQLRTHQVVEKTEDLAMRVAYLSEGTKEAHMNLLISGFGAMLLLMVGGYFAWRQLSSNSNVVES